MKKVLGAMGWILIRAQIKYRQIIHDGVKTKQHTRLPYFFSLNVKGLRHQTMSTVHARDKDAP